MLKKSVATLSGRRQVNVYVGKIIKIILKRKENMQKSFTLP